MANDAPNFRAPMPPKLNQSRSTSGGYQQGVTTRAGMLTQPMLKTRGGMTLQPSGSARPSPIPDPNQVGENGFSPDTVISEHEPDAQSEQCEAPPIAAETDPAETIPTTAKPTSGGETDPIVAGENAPTGGLEEARYSPLTEQSHPVGFPADRRTKE